jgi:hypothetical protein
MSDTPEQIRGKNVVAVIDFHEAILYPTDAAPRQRPERLVATDPEGHFHQVHHHAGNPSGAYEDEPFSSWDTAGGRRTRHTAGLPTLSSITRMSQPKWWRTCASTSITWK